MNFVAYLIPPVLDTYHGQELRSCTKAGRKAQQARWVTDAKFAGAMHPHIQGNRPRYDFGG